ncbi:YkgJ family cysteine cluster protein [Dehalogenimonas sp. 4OHTPN]|uniref:YkgJ family cysteine cluster protein n=1 Tax=Dehalogenimonas sp. 4OHTPN TaxID=3166643 RepID=A0AAU8GCY5_9CHLR
MALQPVQNDDEIEPAFRCFCCGVCCSKYQVQMTIGEAHRIAEKLRIEWDTFESGYLDNAWPGVKTVLLRHSGGHCVFLEPQPGDRTFFCRIQKFKPASCVEWNADADKKDCRDGLAKSWNLGFDEAGHFVGKAENIASLQAFIVSLE